MKHLEKCDCVTKNLPLEKCNCGALKKGGPGSGQVGHKTFHPDQPKSNVHSLIDKLTNPEPFNAHLNMLQHGAVFEGAKLKSGKPVYLNTDQALAHGYAPQDYTDASNFHYKKMEEMSNQMQKIKALGKEPPHAMKKILDFHRKQFKANHSLAETVSRRQKQSEEAQKKGNVKKSVVSMGYQDTAEVDTAKFATEINAPASQNLIEIIGNMMNGYNYGDVPREIMLGKGNLILTKVDDGMYSGYMRLINPVDGGGYMEDNAKVRIERMTIPSLVDFLLAKEYAMPSPSIAGNSPGNNNMMDGTGMQMAQPAQPPMLEPMSESIKPEQYQSLNENLLVESNIDKKIKILELLEKLTSH